MTLLILCAGVEISSTFLGLQKWLPVAEGGWNNKGTWGLENNPHAGEDAKEGEDGNKTSRDARQKFSRCLLTVIEYSGNMERFKQLYVTQQTPEEEVENALVAMLRDLLHQAAAKLGLI